ncbi:MAG: hypothetical protein KAQ94_06110 [Arcobacteraceae bacterium]|nr:hypothetical protein [Arcobacteraceae bacterium]
MLIYDCEIIKAIPNKNEEPIENIEYCKGWGDHKGMGISVAGVYDYIEDRYRVFTQDNFQEFQELIDNRDLIIGFNSLGFDNKLCEANGINISHKNHYDIMLEIAKLVNPNYKTRPSFKGCGLDKCCEVNFNTKKSGNGALAPIDWQNGKIGTVIDYCLNDVKLTKRLLDEIMFNGLLTSPVDENIVLEFDNTILINELKKIKR